MAIFLNQFKQVLRRLGRAPLFTIITLLTLAIGVGANTVVFSVVEGVILKPLSYPHPEQLIGVWYTGPGVGIKELNIAPFLYFIDREQNKSFEDIGVYNGDRWTDVFAQRMQAVHGRARPGLRIAGVLNEGIGGNHLLSDGLGPDALARFDRDVLAQSGARYLIVLEGVNDLGGLGRSASHTQADWDALVQQITGAYRQMVLRAHAHGLRVYGATVMPYTGSDYYRADAASERSRQLVNSWIRTPGHFDAVIDFDKVMADPANPQQLLPAYDSGDHLHPGPAGYRAMGQSVPLFLF